MLSCWAYEASQRPTFSSIVAQMSNILTIASDYLDMSFSPSVADGLKEQENSLSSLISHIPEELENHTYIAGGGYTGEGIEPHPLAEGGEDGERKINRT